MIYLLLNVKQPTINELCYQIVSIILHSLIVNNSFRCMRKNSGNANNDVNLTLCYFKIFELFNSHSQSSKGMQINDVC